jgi:hypothetical protein
LLALMACELFGEKVAKQAATIWTSAGDLLKKEEMNNGWLALALAMPFEDARSALSLQQHSDNPLYQIAEKRSQAILMQAWPTIFTRVIGATTFSTSSTSSSFSNVVQSNNTANVDEILAAMPPSSPSFALALLSKGVEALGRNNKAFAVEIALRLAPMHSQTLASVRAFSNLVGGGRPDIPAAGDSITTNGPIDTLAYTTIAWLAVRQIAKVSLATPNGKGEGSREDDDNESANSTSVAQDEAGLQVATIRLRKLLATEAFTNNVDDAFVDAQDRCVEHLVNIGRQAAGLDALSDSGCEL